MFEEKEEKISQLGAWRGSDRRKGERRKLNVDPADLPFPDRRKGGDRRQMDRRVLSDEEKEEILKRVTVPGSDSEEETADSKSSKK